MTPDTFVDVLIESLELEIGNTVQTPIGDDVKDENPVQLDPEQISKYRSHVARCLFVSQDRADITFAVNELCQKMSDPTQYSFVQTGPETKKRGNRLARELCSWDDTFLKAYTRKQKIIARSSAEAELYAAALGASEANGCREHDERLGFCSEASIDHRYNSNRTHPTPASTWRVCGCRMKSNRTG